EPLGLLDGGDSSFAYGVSGDGSVISGSACGVSCSVVEPFAWADPGPIRGLGWSQGSSYCQGYGVSDDGSAIAGYGVDDLSYDVYPTVWREGTGVLAMARLPGGGTAIAHAASGDGTFLAGRAWDADRHLQAARWTDDGTIQGLGFLADPGGLPYSSGRSITPDGSIVVGTAY